MPIRKNEGDIGEFSSNHDKFSVFVTILFVKNMKILFELIWGL